MSRQNLADDATASNRPDGSSADSDGRCRRPAETVRCDVLCADCDSVSRGYDMLGQKVAESVTDALR